MAHLSMKIRHTEIDRLIGFVISGSGQWTSWIVQGLPGCGVEEVFASLVEQLRTRTAGSEDVRLIELDFASYWTEPVSRCVEALLWAMPIAADSPNSQDQTLGNLLSQLRKAVTMIAETGCQTIFVFDHFDAVLKFSKPDELQHLLSTLQSLCYNPRYRSANIVQCHRDVEDICQTTNYSDYYKVFGSNHHRVSRVSNTFLRKELADSDHNLDASEIDQIVDLCAGYPEHVEVLLRFAAEDNGVSIEEFALDALALTFLEWENCLTPEESAALHAVRSAGSLRPEHFAGIRKLQRKGIITEKNGRLAVASPLFESYLVDRSGHIDDEQAVFVRQGGSLSSVHRNMLEQLFHGHYYLEWQLMQSMVPGNATVYLITGEDQRGIPYRPCIVKIDNAERAASEGKNIDTARAMLGSLVPNVLSRLSLKGQEAVVLEYASGDNRGYSVQQFADFYRERTATEVEHVINRVFGQALHPLYRQQVIRPQIGRRLYFLPRLHLGEFDEIAKIARQSRFHSSETDALMLPGFDAELPNPGVYMRPPAESAQPTSPYGWFFLEKRPVGLCFVHGDLNPRNLLIDGIGNVHLIDFCQMKQEGARFLDFVRLEAEIKFKLTELFSSYLN